MALTDDTPVRALPGLGQKYATAYPAVHEVLRESHESHAQRLAEIVADGEQFLSAADMCRLETAQNMAHANDCPSDVLRLLYNVATGAEKRSIVWHEWATHVLVGVARNKSTPAELIGALTRHPSPEVQRAALANPSNTAAAPGRIQEIREAASEAVRQLDPYKLSVAVKAAHAAARNPALGPDDLAAALDTADMALASAERSFSKQAGSPVREAGIALKKVIASHANCPAGIRHRLAGDDEPSVSAVAKAAL